MIFFLLSAIVMFLALSAPVGGFFALRAIVSRREAAQKKIAAGVSHLKPVQNWEVAYASHAHMETLLKFWSWEDVGVLHLYEEALAFYGEGFDFEISREEISNVCLTTYARTNPMVPWIEMETTGGVRYYFCLPKGLHVFGMKGRAESMFRAIETWMKSSSSGRLLPR